MMKKRVISILLALVMCSTLCATAFASTENRIETLTKQKIADVGMSISGDTSIISTIEKDLTTLESVGFDSKELSIYNISDNDVEYVMSYTPDVKDYICVSYAPDGSTSFTITEDDITNTLTITEDGEYYLDGAQVRFTTYMLPSSTDEVMRARCSEWSKTPFLGYQSNYSVYRGLYSSSVVDTVNTLADLATSTLQMLLAGALDIENVYNVIFDSISLALKARARQNAPTSHYFSCSINKYEYNSNQSFALDRYYMYSGDYYPTSNWTGTPVSGYYFEHNYFF